MEQRRLRLGDILDDYCPRERRVTNHVVVAIIEDEIKQTRCSTCDAEHPYKGGKAPRRRKAEIVSVPPPTTVVARPPDVEPEPESDLPAEPVAEPAPSVHADAMPAPGTDDASTRGGACSPPAHPGDTAAARRDQDRASASGVHDSPERQSRQWELSWRWLRGQRPGRPRCWRTSWERWRAGAGSPAVGRSRAGVRAAAAHRPAASGVGRKSARAESLALLEVSQPTLVIIDANGLNPVAFADDPDRISQVFGNNIEVATRCLAFRLDHVAKSVLP